MTENQSDSDSIVEFMCDPSSSCEINILELHACFRASTIVLTTELKRRPSATLVVQFALVAAVNSLKTAIVRVK